MIGLKFTYTIGVKIVDKYTFFSVVAFTYLRLNTSSLWNDIYFAVLILINRIKDVGIKFAYFCKWCNILNLNSSKIRSTFSLNFPVSAFIIFLLFVTDVGILSNVFTRIPRSVHFWSLFSCLGTRLLFLDLSLCLLSFSLSRIPGFIRILEIN